MAKKQKYYVVWVGHKPGIYDSWDVCQEQVKGFTDAKYKSFESKLDAEKAFKESHLSHIQKNTLTQKVKVKSTFSIEKIIQNSISVDAACSGNPGLMEYRGVETISQKQIFHQGPFRNGTNNIGEFLAIVHALALLEKHKNNQTTIYTDSQTAISWVKNKKAKTKLEQTEDNTIIFNLIQRAEQWLHSHTHRNPIEKWDTENWGEIPADFGRK